MVFIHFQTDGSVTGTGFELEYMPSSKLCSIKRSISFYFEFELQTQHFQIFDVGKKCFESSELN